MTKTYERDLTNGPILKKLILFTLPIIASGILQLLFNAADIIVVGQFREGDSSIAAVGSTASLINLLTNLFIGLAIGANVVVAKHYGAKEYKDFSEAVHTSMLISVMAGVFLTVIGLILAPEMLKLMNTPVEVIDLATIYLRIYFLGMPATMAYNFGNVILRSTGDTRRPLYFLSISGVINVLLNLFLVAVCGMDVEGVGIATVISQYVSAGLIVITLMRDRGNARLELKKLKIHRDKLVAIIKMGLPAGLHGTMFSISNVIIQSSINGFGDLVLAGNSASGSIEGFVYMAMHGFCQAATSFVGQNVGAGRYDRLNRITICSLVCVFLVGAIAGNIAVIFGESLISLYTDSEIVTAYGMERLRIVSGLYALCGLMDVMVGVLRGMGHSVFPMVASIVGVCGLRLIWIYTFFRTTYHSTLSLYLTYPVTWMVTAVALTIYYVYKRKCIVRTT